MQNVFLQVSTASKLALTTFHQFKITDGKNVTEG